MFWRYFGVFWSILEYFGVFWSVFGVVLEYLGVFLELFRSISKNTAFNIKAK